MIIIINNPTSTTASTTSFSTTAHNFSTFSSSNLKVLLTEEDEAYRENVQLFGSCQILVSKGQAAKDNAVAESVESKMKRLALGCAYNHPCHSLVLWI
ncbi:hypothetical protein K492DRAFT_191795 [Lichtheimia hyalospora FSU 10163]|nr:hypothetical protein K492DRAFT_191795 [Lichtheimia hyalospora FSU 10163]